MEELKWRLRHAGLYTVTWPPGIQAFTITAQPPLPTSVHDQLWAENLPAIPVGVTDPDSAHGFLFQYPTEVAAKVNLVLRAYRRFLVATYGNATETLADYGLKPPKARAPRTSEQKASAVVRLRATRKARGTTSKKQKALIHGVVAATESAVAPPTPPKPAT